MRRLSALLLLILAGSAQATTLSLNGEYLNLHLDQAGLSGSESLPGISLRLRAGLADDRSVSLSAFAAKHGTTNYYGGHLSLSQAFSAGFGYFRSGFRLGYRELQASNFRLSAASAGVNLGFFLPVTPSFDAYLSAGVGHTFFAHDSAVSDSHLSGGLYYTGSAGVNYAIAPGAVNLAYRYRHFSLGSNVVLRTDGVMLGYRFSF